MTVITIILVPKDGMRQCASIVCSLYLGKRYTYAAIYPMLDWSDSNNIETMFDQTT
jgi:hypothetical protein